MLNAIQCFYLARNDVLLVACLDNRAVLSWQRLVESTATMAIDRLAHYIPVVGAIIGLQFQQTGTSQNSAARNWWSYSWGPIDASIPARCHLWKVTLNW
jgi:hypothetical protein